MVPAPRNPMPDTTCAATLDESFVSIPNPYCDTMQKSALPSATRKCVRNPASFERYSRSIPIIPPSKRAMKSLSVISNVISILCVFCLVCWAFCARLPLFGNPFLVQRTIRLWHRWYVPVPFAIALPPSVVVGPCRQCCPSCRFKVLNGVGPSCRQANPCLSNPVLSVAPGPLSVCSGRLSTHVCG